MADQVKDREKRIAQAKEQMRREAEERGGKKPEVDTEAEKKRLQKLSEPDNGKPVSSKDSAPSEVTVTVEPMRALAARATEIAGAQGSKLGSAITAPQAQIIKDRLGSDPTTQFEPATLQQLQEYAQGGRGSGRDGLPGDAVRKLSDFCKATGSRRIWPRKVTAMVLALEEERTGRARPNTRPKETKKEEVTS